MGPIQYASVRTERRSCLIRPPGGAWVAGDAPAVIRPPRIAGSRAAAQVASASVQHSIAWPSLTDLLRSTARTGRPGPRWPRVRCP